MTGGTAKRDAETPKPSAKPRRPGPRAWPAGGRIVWLSLILLPVALWAVLLILVFARKGEPVTTGDALLDRYLAALAQRIGSDLVSADWPVAFGIDDAVVDAAIYDGWEPEFGDDPRFWMLRFHLTAEAPRENYSDLDDLSHLRPTYYLEEARRRGAVDGAVLLTLLRANDSQWVSEAGASLSVTRPKRGEDRGPYEEARRAIVDELHGGEHRQLLNELLAAAPDEAVPHYYAAICATQRDDYEGALAHIALGNRASSNNSLIGFPYEALWERMRNGEPLPDKALCGAACTSFWVSVSIPDFLRIKWMFKALLSDAVERGDWQAVDELHTFACRFGSSEGLTSIQALVGVMLVGLVEEAVRAEWPEPLRAEQKRALYELGAEQNNASSQLRAAQTGAAFTQGIQSMSGWGLVPQFELLLSEGRTAVLFLWEAMYQDALQEQTTLGGPVRRLFEEMERFDYTKLGWEE